MSYQATVVKVNVVPHPNADKLALGLVMGTSVVIGKDTKDGDLMVYFPTDGKLSEEFCKVNNLIGYTDPDTGERKGGFFDHRRKVRSQKFRGQKSDGFLAPLSYFETLGPIEDLTEGHSFDTFHGFPICEKYYTPATLREMARNKEGKPKVRRVIQSFAKHVDTEQFAKECGYIPANSIIWITEKLHGTSGRTGKVWVEETQPKKWYHILGFKPKTEKGFKVVNGTRNTVLGKTEKSFYQSEDFRELAIKDWSERLFEGEIVYYEIVGYTTNGQPIMPSVSLSKLNDKELKKVYGENMFYSYGCKPDGIYCELMKPQFDVYVYRITRTDSMGNAVELGWPQVKSRCQELGIKTVPEMSSSPFLHTWYAILGGLNSEECEEFIRETLKKQVDSYLEGSSKIDSTHIREGVVLRVEPPIGKPYWLKAKSFSFKCAEGMIKENENYVDMEEVS